MLDKPTSPALCHLPPKSTPHNETIKNIHINCNSLVPHASEVGLLAKNLSPHIIPISETWCTDRAPHSLVGVEYYTLLRNDTGLINVDSSRDTRGGGGALYIHKTLSIGVGSVVKSKVNSIRKVEYVIQKVKTFSGLLLLIVVVHIYSMLNIRIFSPLFSPLAHSFIQQLIFFITRN